MLYVVVTDTARNPVRSGIQSLVRALVKALGRQTELPWRLVAWNRKRAQLELLRAEQDAALGAAVPRELRAVPWRVRLLHPGAWFSREATHLGLHQHPRHRRPAAGSWVLIPELVYSPGRAAALIRYARCLRLGVAAIVHDTIPVDHPEHVPAGLPALHREFLLALAKADVLLTTSETSSRALDAFYEREGVSAPRRSILRIPAELPESPRVREPRTSSPGAVRALCVSTLETRKNHRGLLAAADLLAERHGSLPFELDLVGTCHAHSQDLRALVETAVARHAGRIRWHGQVEGPALRQFYAGADFTIYPSLLEGFGMPVMESLWHARPCVCANFEVMAENAAAGGCLTADVRNAPALADALERISLDAGLRHELGREAIARPLTTWDDYVRGLLELLQRA